VVGVRELLDAPDLLAVLVEERGEREEAVVDDANVESAALAASSDVRSWLRIEVHQVAGAVLGEQPRQQADEVVDRLRPQAYRRFSRQLRGHAHATPETLHRHFVDTKGELHFAPGGVEVRLRRRTYTPILLEAGYATRQVEVPWRGGRTVSHAFPA